MRWSRPKYSLLGHSLLQLAGDLKFISYEPRTLNSLSLEVVQYLTFMSISPRPKEPLCLSKYSASLHQGILDGVEDSGSELRLPGIFLQVNHPCRLGERNRLAGWVMQISRWLGHKLNELHIGFQILLHLMPSKQHDVVADFIIKLFYRHGRKRDTKFNTLLSSKCEIPFDDTHQK